MKRCFLFLTLTVLFLPSLAFPQERVLIRGEYSYTYGDNESLVEAKNISYSMALRNAIESYKIFIASTSAVKDYRLINDIVQTISSGYLENIKVVSQRMRGRTVITEVQAYLRPEEVHNIITKKVKRELRRDQVVIDINDCLEILKIKKYVVLSKYDPGSKYSDVMVNLPEDQETILMFSTKDITVKDMEGVLNQVYAKPTDKLKRYYVKRIEVIIKALCDISKSDGISGDKYVGINYFDKHGNPIGGDSKAPDKNEMITGQLGTVTFDNVPDYVKSYQVFLKK